MSDKKDEGKTHDGYPLPSGPGRAVSAEEALTRQTEADTQDADNPPPPTDPGGGTLGEGGGNG